MSEVPRVFPYKAAAAARGVGHSDPFFLPPGAQQFAHEARKQLAEIESRWAQLISKIASIQALANAELKNEKRTLQAKTAEDARRILEYSIQEIEVAEQHARHELKVFAADLAVSIARQSIRIDKKIDKGLIRSFVAELGHGGEIAQATLES